MTQFKEVKATIEKILIQLNDPLETKKRALVSEEDRSPNVFELECAICNHIFNDNLDLFELERLESGKLRDYIQEFRDLEDGDYRHYIQIRGAFPELLSKEDSQRLKSVNKHRINEGYKEIK